MAAILAFPKAPKRIQVQGVPKDFLRAVYYIKMADMYDSLPEYINYLVSRTEGTASDPDDDIMTCFEVDIIATLFGTWVDWSKQS